MAETKIAQAEYGDYRNIEENFSVAPQTTDGAKEQKRNEYINSEWTQQFGYYNEIPELRSAIDAKATWTIGKGFVADPETTLILDQIQGLGKDSFNTILENLIRVYNIGGDAFAEIIRDKDGNFVNLKPLNPETIKIIANEKGMIIKYEQIDKVGKVIGDGFKPEKIFHLMRNRVADNFHGTSVIKALRKIILSRNEVMDDMKRLMHRYIEPRIIWELDTDNPTEISDYKDKVEKANQYGENLFLPMGAAKFELLSVPPNATLSATTWIKILTDNFWSSVGVPQIIVGASQEFTEANSKIGYLAFQQSTEEEQLYIEEQVGLQLGLEIDLIFPASLEGELLSDKAKDVQTGAAKPSDLIAGRGQ